jgi:hypothetical protein
MFFSTPTHISGPLEPVSVPVTKQDHIIWLRLLPVNMSTADIEAVLHRSHHAMVPLPFADNKSSNINSSLSEHDSTNLGGQLYLLWGGFSSDMTVLDDLWMVSIYTATVCKHLAPESSWEKVSRCWTAQPVQQHGQPDGRAYAKMVVLKVRESNLHACMWCGRPLPSMGYAASAPDHSFSAKKQKLCQVVSGL